MFSYHVLAVVNAYFIGAMHPFWDLSFFEPRAAVRSGHDWLGKIFFTNWSTPLSVYNFSLLECESIIAQYPWHYIRCLVLLKENFRLICNVTRLIQSHISSHVKRSTPTPGNVSRHGERKPLSELLCSLEVTRQWHISTPTMVCGVSLFLRFHCISWKCHRFNRVSQTVFSM